MSKISKSCLTIILVCICSLSIAFAADQTKDQKRTQDQKKDGTCQDLIMKPYIPVDLAADQTRDRKKDQKQDESCQDLIMKPYIPVDLAADQTRDRKRDQEKDKKQDGSCQS